MSTYDLHKTFINEIEKKVEKEKKEINTELDKSKNVVKNWISLQEEVKAQQKKLDNYENTIDTQKKECNNSVVAIGKELSFYQSTKAQIARQVQENHDLDVNYDTLLQYFQDQLGSPNTLYSKVVRGEAFMDLQQQSNDDNFVLPYIESDGALRNYLSTFEQKLPTVTPTYLPWRFEELNPKSTFLAQLDTFIENLGVSEEETSEKTQTKESKNNNNTQHTQQKNQNDQARNI